MLPVNDTSVRRSWRDSYPYSSLSVFALHPMYLRLSELPGGAVGGGGGLGPGGLHPMHLRLSERPGVACMQCTRTSSAQQKWAAHCCQPPPPPPKLTHTAALPLPSAGASDPDIAARIAAAKRELDLK